MGEKGRKLCLYRRSMWRSTLLGLACAAGSLSFSVPALAQCTKDTECKGDRVCEDGKCVAPSGAASAAAPSAAAPEPSAAPPVADAEPAPLSAADPVAPVVAPPPVVKPKLQRHSTGMMVGGIVMVALAPAALVVSGFTALIKVACRADDTRSRRHCDDSYDPVIYGALLSSVVLVGVGVPLLVVGAKREPVPATATLSPFLTPGGGGLGLRLDL